MPSPAAHLDMADLTTLASQGESETLEFKGSTSQLAAGCQTLCGMLNARGGRVLFGVNDKGALVGQTVSEATLREISQAVRRIDPHAEVSISTIEIGAGKSVIAVTCQASNQAPHAYDGRHWQRVGSTTVPMPQVLVEDRMQERMHGRVRYLAAWPEGDLIRRVMARAARDAGLATHDLPAGLRLRRAGARCFAFNYAAAPLDLPASLTGTPELGTRTLPPAGVAVLAEAAPSR